MQRLLMNLLTLWFNRDLMDMCSTRAWWQQFPNKEGDYIQDLEHQCLALHPQWSLFSGISSTPRACKPGEMSTGTDLIMTVFSVKCFLYCERVTMTDPLHSRPL
ncbi:hypothetical protein AV530_018706 [Patagioenas fasciata monilis]|uniref:Uncharacterized protein n=1 Tax=Patagioenas fasciata monilis TaxID=372326 RepID=A0A1V4JJN1_PATFA|nr:hypothetical protein AV530_018706 [Patagioenas fasciata monilis]